ncbi:MAG: diphosphate--fructose-6-phosphate 1-phosphotransferase [Planctomycetes bacterium]|nr:diphosphate--fructose-6-phosphate 1-phosphotransferase [Planctomycetota bacterium]
MKGKALIGQSGGPTSVINASLAGVVESAGKCRFMTGALGMRYGIEGFLKGWTVDLARQPAGVVKGLRNTPSSALGSCRYKLKDADLPAVLDMLKKFDIRYMFLIGGNDTMDTIHRVEAFCQKNGYDLRGVGVPKTVDNDLFGTDHTPGYGSAARCIALWVLQAGLLARDMQKVDQFVVHQTVGRRAGWLAAAAALAKTTPDSAPHIILMPEVPFDADKFLARAEEVHRQCGYVYVVCGEGVAYADGTPISASQVKDKFANVEFGAMGGTSAAIRLHKMLADKFGWRGEFQVTESLPMCAADRPGPHDVQEAYRCGAQAVKLAAAGQSGVMVSMVRAAGKKYKISFAAAPLSEVAVHAKPMPPDMISPDGMHVTKAFLDYARPLVGKLPDYVTLKSKY